MRKMYLSAPLPFVGQKRMFARGNVHIYENNIPGTRALIAGDETVRFGLNV